MTRRPAMDLAALLAEAHVAHQAGALARAARRYEAILARDPGHDDALHLLGFLHYQMGRPAQALRHLSAAVQQNEPSPELWSTYGLVLHAAGRNAEAVRAFDAALALAPDDVDVLNRRGVACLHLDRGDEALAAFERVLARAPRHVDALGNRGNALLKLNRLEEALASYDTALGIGGDTAPLLTNRAHVLRRLGRLDEAAAEAGRALALAPTFAEAAFERGLAQLTLGDFSAGWENYEQRWRTAAFSAEVRTFISPRWSGAQALSGTTILLHAEQGFGDTIQFARYAPLLAARGARVILEVQPALRRLLDGLPGVAQVIARGERRPPFDWHCPLLSLPHAFATTLATIPAAVAPPLPADDATPWRDLLPAGKALIGVCWAGDSAHRNDANRSMPLARFAQLWDGLDAAIVSLQVGGPDRAAARADICDVSSRLTDFAATASLMRRLDVVVTVDTAVAHLAGTLRVPTLLLLPYSGDFRWLRERDDSPWYPTLRLFRQRRPGDWDAPIAAARDHLRQQMAARAASAA